MNCRIRPVFHVSQLKKKVGVGTSVKPQLPPFSDDGLLLVEPDNNFGFLLERSGK